jgi:alkyl sulfatase BDS1-like metallo-beta-lactamase superfamily hydrolase
MADAGNVAFDISDYDFLNGTEEFDSIHPSMTRIARLNNNFGLYEVIPGIYQVRGFDLSDMTFVRGATGWIVFDVLTTTETARAAWELFQEHVGEGLPVTAVIYSHTHGDHWGGVRGILTTKTCAPGGSRSSRRAISCSSRSPRTSSPATR